MSCIYVYVHIHEYVYTSTLNLPHIFHERFDPGNPAIDIVFVAFLFFAVAIYLKASSRNVPCACQASQSVHGCSMAMGELKQRPRRGEGSFFFFFYIYIWEFFSKAIHECYCS